MTTASKLRRRNVEQELIFAKPPFTPQLMEVLNRARITARTKKDNFVRIEHVLSAMATLAEARAAEKYLK